MTNQTPPVRRLPALGLAALLLLVGASLPTQAAIADPCELLEQAPARDCNAPDVPDAGDLCPINLAQSAAGALIVEHPCIDYACDLALGNPGCETEDPPPVDPCGGGVDMPAASTAAAAEGDCIAFACELALGNPTCDTSGLLPCTASDCDDYACALVAQLVTTGVVGPDCTVETKDITDCAASLVPQQELVLSGGLALESIRVLEQVRFALDGLLQQDLEVVGTEPRLAPANAHDLVEMLDQAARDVTGDASATYADLPADVLAAIALKALPMGPQTPYYGTSTGQALHAIVNERFEAVHAELQAEYQATETGVGGWPTNDWILGTVELREERAILGTLLVYLDVYHANQAGNLGAEAERITQIAFGSAMDFGIVDDSRRAAAVGILDYCQTLQGLVALLLELVADLVPLAMEYYEFLEQAALGAFVDALYTVGYAASDLPVNPGGPVATGYDTVDSVLREEGVVGTITGLGATYPGVGLGGSEASGEGAGKWSVNIMRTTSNAVDSPWTLSIINAPMPYSFESAVDNTPVTLPETGTVTQESGNEHVIFGIVDEPPKEIVIQPDAGDCRNAKWGVVGVYVVGVASATAVGAVGGPFGAGAAFAGAVVAGGVAAYQSADQLDECKPKSAWDPGRYVETGAFVNRWWDFSWSGNGLLGQAMITGSADVVAAAPFIDGVVYTNLGSTTGWATGKSSAERARDSARNLSDDMVPQFRPVKGTGSAQIDIFVTCALVPNMFAASASADADASGITGSLCLAATVGNTLAAGSLEGEGYSCEIEVAGAAASGYIESNGQRVPFPVALDLEGTGVNS